MSYHVLHRLSYAMTIAEILVEEISALRVLKPALPKTRNHRYSQITSRESQVYPMFVSEMNVIFPK